MLERTRNFPIGEPETASENLDKSRGLWTCEKCGDPVPLRKNGRPRVHAFCDRPECRRAADAARKRALRAGIRFKPLDPPMPDHVRTIHSNNSALIAAAARLYVPDNAIVVDVTWGMGVFWKRFNGRRRRFTLWGSDIEEKPGQSLRADFRHLPYRDATIDVVVLDPPYVHCGHYYNNHRYGAALTDHLSPDEIIELYRAGMVEARRVLRPGGTMWVKCKDESGSGRQNWHHITLHNIALELGLRSEDLFVLASRPAPRRRHQRMKHALKTHSYLWVFRKPRERKPKADR
jgi:hypothetical protein